jgi:hypothetical protein
MDDVMKRRMLGAAAIAAWLFGAGLGAAAPPPDSKRLAQGKDYITDEQWSRAIVELQAAADDPHERNRDEALFWLAHCEHQSGDDSSAIQTIARLERVYPRSRWMQLARSVRVEIAQRMRRDDVLWAMVAPPAPPSPPPATARPGTPATVVPHRPGAATAAQPGRGSTPPPSPSPVAIPPPPLPPRQHPPTPPAAYLPPSGTEYWGTMPEPADQVIRIEALAGLIESHGDRAVPLLRDIALDQNSPDEARRAVLVLAHSLRADAHNTVVEVARVGAEPVRLAAIRELGRFQDVNVSNELMRVYSTGGTPRIRRQVVSSLGERADNVSLIRIVKSESDPTVRNTAIMTLGRIPAARDQLRLLYTQAPRESRDAVIAALFASRDDDELIRIASNEKDSWFRQRARQQLRMLATPKAVKFLADNP